MERPVVCASVIVLLSCTTVERDTVEDHDEVVTRSGNREEDTDLGNES